MAKVEHRMDMDKLNDIHRETAEEILHIFEDFKDLPKEDLKEKIKESFDLKKIPLKDVKESVWYNSLDGFDIPKLGMTMQGTVKKTVEGQIIKIPFMNINADLDTLDNLVNHIVQKYSHIKK